MGTKWAGKWWALTFDPYGKDEARPTQTPPPTTPFVDGRGRRTRHVSVPGRSRYTVTAVAAAATAAKAAPPAWTGATADGPFGGRGHCVRPTPSPPLTGSPPSPVEGRMYTLPLSFQSLLSPPSGASLRENRRSGWRILPRTAGQGVPPVEHLRGPAQPTGSHRAPRAALLPPSRPLVDDFLAGFFPELSGCSCTTWSKTGRTAGARVAWLFSFFFFKPRRQLT